jgi:hypothetical protein
LKNINNNKQTKEHMPYNFGYYPQKQNKFT